MKYWLTLMVGLLVLLGGCGTGDGSAPSAHPGVTATAAIPKPVRIDIKKIEAHSTLVEVGLDSQEHLQTPPKDQPGQAAWFRDGPRVGSDGPAVILGHVDGEVKGKKGQPGIFWRLHELVAGDKAKVTRADGTALVFVVYRIVTAPKDAFPTEDVYGKTAGPELRLITCSGDFNRTTHHYTDNTIVFMREEDPGASPT